MDAFRQISISSDVAEDAYLALRSAQTALQDMLRLDGYRYVDTPILEETDLFLRKSGGELAARMYSFVDPGGRQVSLRPEFTASVIRAFLGRQDEEALPHRVQYAGPVFRHEPDTLQVNRQFTQVGAEFLGSAAPEADAEILSLVCRGMAAVGLSGARLVMGHVGAVSGLLEAYGLSERARAFVISRLRVLSQGGDAQDKVLQEAEELGLLNSKGAPFSSGKAMRSAGNEQDGLAEAMIQDVSNGFVGSRSPEEVVHRFLRKLAGADDPSNIQRGIALAAGLAKVAGPPRDALKEAGALAAAAGLDNAALDECSLLIDAIDASDLAGVGITLDFSRVRSIAYYTGMVFEVEHPALPTGLILCGGGRYDGLVRALGGAKDIPALGFAFGLEPLVSALEGG
ncbi:MAG: histidyl-tRNA synthetase [Chloroflexi bacterium]|nr:MAG: histidyl-tRNA synthetase [Chloroflexota bacterium]